jgi:hypothetical protein
MFPMNINRMSKIILLVGLAIALLAAATAHALETPLHDANDRGLRFSMRASTPNWSLDALYALPTLWNRPDIAVGSPEFYDEIFRRYGLHRRAESDRTGGAEDILPLGLVLTNFDFKNSRDARNPDGQRGLMISCEACHSTSLFGQQVVGLGNPFNNGRTLFQDLALADGSPATDHQLPYEITPNQVSMVNGADHLGVIGLYLRNADLTLNLKNALKGKAMIGLGDLRERIASTAYLKTPAWFNFKTKYEASNGASTQQGYGFFADGGLSRNSVFADFTFMITFSIGLKALWNASELVQARSEWDQFARGALMRLEAPRYPFPVDIDLAKRGFDQFAKQCASCHGTYDVSAWETLSGPSVRWPAPELVRFEQKIVPQQKVGTNAKRLAFTSTVAEDVNRVLGQGPVATRMILTGGYVVPPLLAIFSRFPYLHTGGVPDLATLLTPPSQRPERWMFAGDPDREEDYDQARLGLKTVALGAGETAPPYARVYEVDESAGLSKEGHSYGTSLSDEEKRELLEFLKAL